MTALRARIAGAGADRLRMDAGRAPPDRETARDDVDRADHWAIYRAQVRDCASLQAIQAEEDAVIARQESQAEARLDASLAARNLWRCGCQGAHPLGAPAGCCNAVDPATLAMQLRQQSLPFASRPAFTATLANPKDATGPADDLVAGQRLTPLPSDVEPSGRPVQRESCDNPGGDDGAPDPAGVDEQTTIGIPAGSSVVNPIAVLPPGADCLCGTADGPCFFHERGADVALTDGPAGPHLQVARGSHRRGRGAEPAGRVGVRR